MKIEVSTYELNRSLKVLSKVKGENNGFNIIADRDITVVRMDTDTTITIKLDGYVMERGSTVFPMELISLIKKLPVDNLTISNDSIGAESRIIRFLPIEAQGLPKLDGGESIFSTTGKELRRMLKVKYSWAQDEIRPVLAGVCFNCGEACALDGYRLSLRKSDFNTDRPYSFVVNRNSIEILDSVLNNYEGYVFVSKAGEFARFQIGNIEIIGRIVPGEFINYKNIISYDHRYIAKFNIPELRREMDFIKGIDTDVLRLEFNESKLNFRTNQVVKTFDKEASDNATAEARNKAHYDYMEKLKSWESKKAIADKKKKPFNAKVPEEKTVKPQTVYSNRTVAEITGSVGCDFNSKDVFKIHVNPKYIIEAIANYEDFVEFQMTTCVSPIIITQDGKDLELVLPVRMVE